MRTHQSLTWIVFLSLAGVIDLASVTHANDPPPKDGGPPRFLTEPLPSVTPGDDDLRRKMKEIVSPARTELASRYGEYVSGRGTLEVMYDSAGRLLKSRLELCEDSARRVATYEQYIEWCKAVESIQQERLMQGRIANKDYELSRYMRMDAEIRLLREQRKSADR
jgi:hypothetical protein